MALIVAVFAVGYLSGCTDSRRNPIDVRIPFEQTKYTRRLAKLELQLKEQQGTNSILMQQVQGAVGDLQQRVNKLEEKK